MSQYRITISLPCYGRPIRTKRAIECIMNQDINGWEAFIMGDGCPYFEDLITSGYLPSKQLEAQEKSNKLVYFNSTVNHGGCGYHLTNYAIQNATGKFFVFFANDDVIEANHLSHYLEEIENCDLDFIYFNTYLAPLHQMRVPQLINCGIGHSELIVRTEFLKKQPPHSPYYGHDWDLISNMINTGKYSRAASQQATYKVMSLPTGTIDNFD